MTVVTHEVEISPEAILWRLVAHEAIVSSYIEIHLCTEALHQAESPPFSSLLAARVCSNSYADAVLLGTAQGMQYKPARCCVITSAQ